MCNFNINILIQTNKEDINKNINYINNISKNDSEKIKDLIKSYNYYLSKLNNNNDFSVKKFYILLKINPEKNKKINIEFIREEMNSNYLKIKDSLERCGNKVYEVDSEDEAKNIINSFFNVKRKNKDYLF